MNHFKGINDRERYDNEMMDHTQKQTEMLVQIRDSLEQIAQLLQPKGEIDNVMDSTEGIPVHSISEGQQGQRSSNGTRSRGK